MNKTTDEGRPGLAIQPLDVEWPMPALRALDLLPSGVSFFETRARTMQPKFLR